jgi:superfamily II DNA or RNA helicase
MPAFLNSSWDGRVTMLNLVTRTLPYGLFIDLVRYNKKNNIEAEIDPEVLKFFRGNPVNPVYDLKFYPHDFQQDCIEAALQYKRGIIRSATASGKSLIIAYILKTLFDHSSTKRKALIIVPTISLVEQFYKDLLDYGYFTSNMIGRVYEKYKEFDRDIVISTWQTLMKRHKRLNEFTDFVCDETHGAKAHEIKKILQKCTNAEYRLGFTGTLPTEDLDVWNIKAYLGPVIRDYGAGELGEKGYVSKANITILNIQYKKTYKGSYDEVKDDIFRNPFRLDVIKSIVDMTDSNTLLLVGMVEREGQILKTHLSERIKGKEIIFLHGATKVEDREFWRLECEKRKDLVIIATYGIFQQGINIPSLKYIVLASPYKSKVRVLQSIGRVLRTHKDKENGAYIFDIFDDCKYLFNHGVQREKHYRMEGFEVRELIFEEGQRIELSPWEDGSS